MGGRALCRPPGVRYIVLANAALALIAAREAVLRA